MGSLVVPVKKAVLDGFADYLAGLDDFNGNAAPERNVEVSYGFNFGSVAAEMVYGGKANGQTPPAALRSGANVRQETGTFDVSILVKFVGGDTYDADLRVDEIGSEFEEWAAARKSNQLGISGLQTFTVRSWEADYMQVDGGTASIRTYSCQFTGRNE